MTDVSTIGGSRSPANPTTYNPIAGGSFPIGTPVAQSLSDDGTVVAANSGSEDTTYVTGIAASPGASGGRVLVQYGNVLELTADQWDEITSGSGGLERESPYYLSDEDGKLTTTPPGSGFIVPVGVAVSATELLIRIGAATPA